MTMTQLASADSRALAPTDLDGVHLAGGATIGSREAGTLPVARLKRVTEYIQEHLDEDLTLAQLGAVAYMSPYHFARLFRRSTGLPPHRFVVRVRIDRSAALLASPEPSIARISREVGFRTPSHFSTVFRRLMGVTPSAYRADRLRPESPREGSGVAGPAPPSGGSPVQA